MTKQEARGWLAGGQDSLPRGKPGSDRTWGASICTPATGGRPGMIILSFGASLEAAASRAEGHWDDL